MLLWRLTIEKGFDQKVHAAQAIATMRSLKRSKKILSKLPESSRNLSAIDVCFGDIESIAFKNSLKAGLVNNANFFERLIYLHVWRSKRMFYFVLWLSVKLAAIKDMLRRSKAV